jgi:hypothetical protein
MGRNTADGMDQALGQVFSLGGPCDVASGSASGRLRSSTGGPRSVFRYIERLTEPGMTQALKGRGGVCARVIENGTVRVVGEIDLL